MALIESRQNAKVKLVRALDDRKTREAEKLFVVEGTFHIGTALEARAEFEFVLYAPSLLRGDFAQRLIPQLTSQTETLEASEEILESLSSKDNPQGMLAVIKQPARSLADLRLEKNQLAVAAVTPQDPGNLGTLLRTVDAAGAAALILLEGGVDPYHPQAVRASMGAGFWKPPIQANFASFANWAQRNQYAIIGSSAKAELDYARASYALPSALLLGSEREGLSAEQLAACAQVVKLPMRGHVTSLNLSVAAGILIYKIIEKS